MIGCVLGPNTSSPGGGGGGQPSFLDANYPPNELLAEGPFGGGVRPN